ncbi:ABC transporter permease [Frateuria aurantia]|uniref:ABC-type antimicrobial peptide transport system, permease component n=1 Tax=Frateuria aurantia (strain ATCC 33424 / DSM 6220 / KCTC 2777 / LMG 1558 / NBRC 3245 / NCIMB 13370) TaxID=767434 RepID=H8L4B9_FRAAD|nr:FtsX-like permease family protein [Frateuria aurantia]AFC84952.1 ABC-type antimicrobial peptide transport system, permease component [Frateuria aurantia DSM 6220]
MRLPPVLAALRWHKAGAMLIALQIALTLAIVSNALFIIEQRSLHRERPSGLKENDLLLVSQMFAGPQALAGDARQLEPMHRADLAALRQLPGVKAAGEVNTLPLLGSGWNTGVSLKPDADDNTVHVAEYLMDEAALPTLGLKLLAGRNFTQADLLDSPRVMRGDVPQIMVTKALAQHFFPAGAVGHQLYLSGSRRPSTIIGVVERLQNPAAQGWGDNFAWNSIVVPQRMDGTMSTYVIRARPGQMPALYQMIPKQLLAVDRLRVMNIRGSGNVVAYSALRAQAYKSDRGMATLMAVICTILLTVTAGGVVGLTSFWVGQRRRQIGVRRALGARRRDILAYFLSENLLISGVGAVLGMGLSLLLNRALMHWFELPRMPPSSMLLGLVLIEMVSVAAVLMPALKASRIAPSSAIREA